MHFFFLINAVFRGILLSIRQTNVNISLPAYKQVQVVRIRFLLECYRQAKYKEDENCSCRRMEHVTSTVLGDRLAYKTLSSVKWLSKWQGMVEPNITQLKFFRAIVSLVLHIIIAVPLHCIRTDIIQLNRNT